MFISQQQAEMPPPHVQMQTTRWPLARQIAGQSDRRCSARSGLVQQGLRRVQLSFPALHWHRIQHPHRAVRLKCGLRHAQAACAAPADLQVQCQRGMSLQALPQNVQLPSQEHMDDMLSSAILPGLVGLCTVPVYAVVTDGHSGFVLLPPEVSSFTIMLCP